ncbi:hypothetical protein N8T08_001883 [Aspergillus melleus]|uniref:Uncharacterized protein n=1 Tax=Aspergillus melleus TaxID=138277 RepID=A0ACC3B9E4_9EURO|nr:hypothetical protein N8T08_001883 [Aspergillus melleus]
MTSQQPPSTMEETTKDTQPTQQDRPSFTIENLNFFVNAGGAEKRLLNQVSWYVKPGQLTALMGASGAGKTTLLGNLSRRKAEGRMTGEILFGGAALSPSFGRSCGFCMQQDIHEPATTVREALQFSALFRQPTKVSREEKLAYVEHIISLLELEKIADALVGSTGVEERKRVTIGVELAVKPSALLFLDEPSGVLFEMFDHVMLLAPGGQTVYFGETGDHASKVSAYFARYGAVMSAKDNPAEFIISTVYAKGPNSADWPQIWSNSPEKEALGEKIRAMNAMTFTPATESGLDSEKGQYALPIVAQILILTQRHWKAVWRNGQYNLSRLFKCLFFKMFVAFTFFHISNSSAGLQNHMFGILLSIWVIPTVCADVHAIWYEKWSIFEARE